MDKFDIEANTGKIESPTDFSELSSDKEIAEKLSFCQTKDAQMHDT
jgi:hypothetical protein